MFKRNTVLVVGAGCSAEFGLPAGYSLKHRIADELSRVGRISENGGFTVISSSGSDEQLRWAIEHAGRERGSREWLQIANGLASGIRHAPSIDNYLRLHNDDEPVVEIGKIAIAREIMRAERSCPIGTGKLDLPSIKKALTVGEREPNLWLEELVAHAQLDVNRSDMGRMFENLTIITFNYDRVIEHYLFHAIRDLARLTDAEAGHAMSRLEIIHPYGKIGRLPWQKDDGSPVLPFGGASALHGMAVVNGGKRLRTFTETVDDEEILDGIRRCIHEAKQLVFMGFSYMPENLRLLSAPKPTMIEAIFATRLGESDSNTKIAFNNIRQMAQTKLFGPEVIRWQNATAGDFLHEFGRELTS